MHVLKNVKLMTPGKWNGRTFTEQDLKSVADAAKGLSAVLSPPLKMGHNDEQPMTDGQPRLGNVSNVTYTDGALRADFMNLPDVVYDAIKARLYDSLSIELDANVEYKSNNYPYVLTAVALLGADLPAVNTLDDLSSYMSKDYRAMSRLSFTVNKDEGGNPTMLTEQEIAELKAKAARAEALEAENLKFKADKAEYDKQEAQRKFDEAKATATRSLDDLVKDGHINPAQRDEFAKQMVDEASIDYTLKVANTLKMGKPPKPENEQGAQDDGADNSGDPADVVLLSKVRELRASTEGSALSFSVARDRIMKANPELARDYVNLTKEV